MRSPRANALRSFDKCSSPSGSSSPSPPSPLSLGSVATVGRSRLRSGAGPLQETSGRRAWQCTASRRPPTSRRRRRPGLVLAVGPVRRARLCATRFLSSRHHAREGVTGLCAAASSRLPREPSRAKDLGAAPASCGSARPRLRHRPLQLAFDIPRQPLALPPSPSLPSTSLRCTTESEREMRKPASKACLVRLRLEADRLSTSLLLPPSQTSRTSATSCVSPLFAFVIAVSSSPTDMLPPLLALACPHRSTTTCPTASRTTSTASVAPVVPALRVPPTATSPRTRAVRPPPSPSRARLSRALADAASPPSLPPSLLLFARAGLAKDLIKILTDAKQVVPPQLQEIAQFGGGGGGRGGGGRGRGGGGGGRGYGGGGGGGYGGGGYGASPLPSSSSVELELNSPFSRAFLVLTCYSLFLFLLPAGGGGGGGYGGGGSRW